MTERTTPALHVWIDPGTCIGSGSCVRLAAGTFAMGADGVAYVTDPEGATLEKLRLAERSCPTGAIFIEQPQE
jgi:ferredoxin